MSRALAFVALLALPATAIAQATNPPYMAQFPTVERVKQVMKMDDPRESALRQMGALWQLQEVIKQLSGRREFRGLLPDEAKVLGEYQVAEYYIGQAIDSAFPGPYGNWKKVSMNTPYRYMRTDPRFGVEGVELAKVLPVAVLEAFSVSVGQDKARWAARARNDSLSMIAAQRAQQQAASGEKDDGSAAIRRCVESGRSQMQCMFEGFGQGIKDLATAALPGLKPLIDRKIYGLRMGGVYAGQNSLGLTFYTETVSLNCSELVTQNLEYSTAVVPEGVRVTVNASPRPIVLLMRPDGRLVGAGPVDIQGQVQVGIQYGTRTWSDGRTEPISRPVYETQTRRCNTATLALRGPSPNVGTGSAATANILNTVLGSPDPQASKPTPAGLRVSGEYGTQSALDLDFRPEGVVVGCGPVTVLRDYTVRAAANQAVVTIQNGGTPFTVQLGADGRMSGSGTVQVDGRKVTSVQEGGKLNYAPRSASCPLGVLAPTEGPKSSAQEGADAARASLGISTTPAAPTNAGPAFSIVSGLPVTAAGGNALAGAAFLLLDVPLDNVIKEAGVNQPAGISSPRLLEQTCNGIAGQENCGKIVQMLRKHTVVELKPDANGVANTPDLTAGKTYYLFGSAVSQARKITWHLPLRAVTGWTKVTLTAANAVP